MESFATPYAVFFNDGEQELDKGVIGIHSCLTFKRFQSMVGQKTGLPSAQLATVFVYKKSFDGVEKKQKIPINENTNFGIILSQHNASKEKDSFFLVSLKRSKKERKASKKRADTEATEDEASQKEEISLSSLRPDEDPAERVKEEVPVEAKVASLETESSVPEKVQPPQKVQPPPVPSETIQPKLRLEASKSPEKISDANEAPVSASAQVSASVPVSASAPASAPAAGVTCAWKSGSILQRLAVQPITAPTKLPTVQDATASAVSRPQAMQCRVHHPHGSSSASFKSEQTAGSVSPTSVLDHNQHMMSIPAIGPPASAPGGHYMHSGGDRGALSFFGQGLQGVDIRSLLQDAMMTSNIQYNASKWCKFCAFCRERNMSSAPFHWCVDDQVVSGFRGPNPAGPIGTRAMKQRLAAA